MEQVESEFESRIQKQLISGQFFQVYYLKDLTSTTGTLIADDVTQHRNAASAGDKCNDKKSFEDFAKMTDQ